MVHKSDKAAADKASRDTCPNRAESVVFIPTQERREKKMGIPKLNVSMASSWTVGFLIAPPPSLGLSTNGWVSVATSGSVDMMETETRMGNEMSGLASVPKCYSKDNKPTTEWTHNTRATSSAM